MRGALLSFTLAALLGGCSAGPAAPTVETGTMVVRPADNWPYGATPRYALAEQFQYAGNSASSWLEPVQRAVTQTSASSRGTLRQPLPSEWQAART